MRVHVSVEQQHVVQRPVSDVIWLKIRVRLQRVSMGLLILEHVPVGQAQFVVELHYSVRPTTGRSKKVYMTHAFVPTLTNSPEIRAYHQKGKEVKAMTSSEGKDVEDFLVADCNFKRACIKAVGDVNARLYARKMNEFHLTVVYRVRVVKKETRVIILRAWIHLAGMFVLLATMHQRLLTLVKRVQPTNIRTRIMNLVWSVNLVRRAKNL